MKKVKVKSKKLKDLKHKLLIIKVGDSDRPASQPDIDDVKKIFKKALKGIKCRLVVCHHAVDIRVV